jgi:hypothetical protein
MSDPSVIHDMSLYLYLFRCRVFLFTFYLSSFAPGN